MERDVGRQGCLPTPLHHSTVTSRPTLAFKNHTTPMQQVHTHLSSCALSSLFPSMSTNQLSNANNLYKNLAHRRRDSGEIDAFEDACYFSDSIGLDSRERFHAAVKQERVASRPERKSLDMFLETMHPQNSKKVERHSKEKSKQPISPVARLASFFDSFFLQTASKKKAKSLKDEGGLGGRRGRFSISHSRSIRSSVSKYIYSSKSSVFRTPLPCPDTRTMNNKYNAGEAGKAKFSDGLAMKNKFMDYGSSERDGMLEGSRFVGEYDIWSDVFVENKWVLKGSNDGYLQKDKNCYNKLALKERQIFRRGEEEDGGNSDSSSDLFELKNYDLSDVSNGLPVYGTTNMEAIKREVSITSAS